MLDDLNLASKHEIVVPRAAAVHDDTAAEILIKHLFAQPSDKIPGIDYAVGYKPADGPTGGDILDVFPFDNGSVGFSIADISGKGVRAAVHAALIKYAIRAYVSEEQTAETVLRSLNRLFLENNAFEKADAFASVFVGIVDSERRMMTYASGGHEPVMLICPGKPVRTLAPTAPLVGVFRDQDASFGQAVAALEPGCNLVATTDGVTEARRGGELYGMERLTDFVARYAAKPVEAQVRSLLSDVSAYCYGKPQDDIAILVARIL
jgi:sigma-B regulation protein RsbU (phosphoserine phosphatase)